MEFLKSVLYYVTVAFLVFYIIVLLISPGSMMDVFGFRTFFVLSNSMEPVLNVNDLIVSTTPEEDEIEVGDIISFKVYLPELGGQAVVTHYVGDITTVGETVIYHTKGTHQADGIYDKWEDDEGNRIYITFDDIEGTYLFKIPYIGYIKDIVKNKTMVTMILVNAGVIYFLVSYLRRDKEEEEE